MLYINNLSAIQIIEDFQQYYDLKKGKLIDKKFN